MASLISRLVELAGKPQIISRAMFICACLLAAATSLLVLLYHDPVAFSDMVSVEHFLSTIGSGERPWTDLFVYTSNEHRVTVPMIFYAMDHFLFGSQGDLLTILNLSFTAGFTFLITCRFTEALSLDQFRLLAAGALILLFFWPVHSENFIWTHQVQLTCSLFFAVLTLYLATRPAKPTSAGLAGITGAAVVSSLSFGYGLVLWPLLGAYGFVRRWPIMAYASFAIGVITVVIVFNLTQREIAHHASVFENLFQPLSVISYMTAFLGGPAHHAFFRADYTGLVIGVLCLGLVVMITVQTAQRLRAAGWRVTDILQGEMFLILLMYFGVGAASLTALTRANFGHEQAYSPRYLFVAFMVWISLFGLIMLRRHSLSFYLRYAGTGLAGLLLSTIAVSYSKGWASILVQNYRIESASVPYILGIQDPSPKYDLYPSTDLVQQLFAYYQERESVGVYTLSWAHWPGKELSSVFFRTNPEPCQGIKWDIRLEPIDTDTSRLTGWTSRSDFFVGVNWVLATDKKKVIRGLAPVGGPSNTAPSVVARYFGGLDGYTNSAAGIELQIYALTGNKQLCKLGQITT